MEKTLQDLLYSCIDLSLLLKHVHWNVRGKGFNPFHTFLDTVYKAVLEVQDTLAERMVTLNIPASGLAEDVANNSKLTTLPVKFMSVDSGIDELTERLKQVVDQFYAAVNSIEEPVTGNILQDMTGTLDKYLWLLRSQKPFDE